MSVLESGVEPPVLRRRVQASYTESALQRKVAGSVVLEAVSSATDRSAPPEC